MNSHSKFLGFIAGSFWQAVIGYRNQSANLKYKEDK